MMIISRVTAFEVDFLFRMVLKVYHHNATWEGLADEYNDLHSKDYENIDEMRWKIDAQRISDGFLTYTFLELNQRWGFTAKLDGSKKDIENCILQHQGLYKAHFHAVWSIHKCEVKGCRQWLTCDGGMGPRRNVCAARYSGVITYKHTNTMIVCGCTKKPSPGSQFCADHKTDVGPVVLAENLSKETRDRLRKTRSLNYPQDNIFFVKSLL